MAKEVCHFFSVYGSVLMIKVASAIFTKCTKGYSDVGPELKILVEQRLGPCTK